MRKIYLAGPEVFYPGAERILKSYQKQCADAGFIGLSPLDADLPEGISDKQRATAIYQANIGEIWRCDAVIANLHPLCGPEPDSGTCFEIGYAAALGKPIFLYGPACTIAWRYSMTTHPACAAPEEFGFNMNLMLQIPATCYEHSFEAALEKVDQYFAR